MNDKPVITISSQVSIPENTPQAVAATLSASDEEDTTANLALTGNGADDAPLKLLEISCVLKADYETKAVYYVQVSATILLALKLSKYSNQC